MYRVRDWVGEGSAFAQARGAEAATIKTVLDNVEVCGALMVGGIGSGGQSGVALTLCVVVVVVIAVAVMLLMVFWGTGCCSAVVNNQSRPPLLQDWLYGEGEHESAERYAAEASKLQKVLEHAQAAINNKNQKK